MISGRTVTFYVLLVLSLMSPLRSGFAHESNRGFVEVPNANNLALIVGVSHGLPGIDIDVDNVDKIAVNPAYQFHSTRLLDEQGTTHAIAADLLKLSEKVDTMGTLLFYFSGHGSYGIIYPQDRTMKIEEIRQAIMDGRKNQSPLQRLVLVFDSCHSGSLLDPVRRTLPFYWINDERIQTTLFADEVVRAMTDSTLRNGDEGTTYWKKLFVFASSRADETSLAGENGSVFTLAFKKGFEESIAQNSTIGEFITKTQTYTVGHHPVARLLPETLAQEKMKN